MELKLLLSSAAPLPSVPKIVALLASELARTAPDLRKISQLFSADPALTARLLARANQGASPFARDVGSIAQALALLRCADLVPLVAQAAGAGGLQAVPGLALPQFWRYSLNVAKLARALAKQVRQNQASAYTAGLVHAVGEFLMYAAMPAEMAALDQQAALCDARRVRHQQRLFGFTFADVSAGLARQWQFPPTLVDALAHQVAPFDNDAYEPLAGLVHLASWRARAREAGLTDRGLAVSFPDQVGLPMGLDIDMVLQQDPFDWFGRSELDPA